MLESESAISDGNPKDLCGATLLSRQIPERSSSDRTGFNIFVLTEKFLKISNKKQVEKHNLVHIILAIHGMIIQSNEFRV